MLQIRKIDTRTKISEANKTVNAEVSEDSVATNNEIDCFGKVGLLCKKHIKNVIFGQRVSLTSEKKSLWHLFGQ